MKRRSIFEWKICALACIAWAGTTACSSGSGSSGSTGDVNAGGGTGMGTCQGNLSLSFTPMYSAYDGTHTFQVPAIANGVSGAAVTWSASDPSMVTFEDDPTTGGTLITMQKAGQVTIQATAGDKCGTSLLTITAATPQDWDVGNQRYNSGYPLPNILANGTPQIPADGSNPLEVPGQPPACTNCHGETATKSVFQTVSHTPEQTGGFSDDQLAGIFMNGVIPPGGYYDSSIVPQGIWQFFHKWTDITDAQKKGVIVYLRSLTPKPQGGKVDFQQIVGGGTPGGAGGATGAGGASPSGAGGG